MNKMLWLLPALLLGSAVQAQQNNDDEAGNGFVDMPPEELRQRIADAPGIVKDDWYQVEVVIFKRKDPITDEYWRLDREPELASSVIRLAGESEDTPQLPQAATDAHRAAAEREAWHVLKEDKRSLGTMTERMLDRGNYRILFHESWRQPVRQRNQALPIYVQGGQRIMPPLQRLPDPSASASTQPKPDSDNQNNGPGQTNRRNDQAFLPGDSLALPEMHGTLLLHVSRYLHIEPNLWLTDRDARGKRYNVQIDQSRRMRSEELHYLDHPKFGLLIQLDPWQSEKQKKIKQMEEALEKQKDKE